MVHKESKRTLVLLLDPIEFMTNQYRCQEWLEAVQQPGYLATELPQVVSVQAGNHGPNQVILIEFRSEDDLKEWVKERIIPVIQQSKAGSW
jgi:heme-degrading monooxygenase HmoA